jgi:hypothetical protein
VVKETGVLERIRNAADSSSSWIQALSSLSSSWWCLGLSVCVCGVGGGQK